MVVFDYNVFSNIDLSSHLKGVLQSDMGLRICVHNGHLYISVMKSHGMCLLKCKRIKQEGCL